MTAPQRVRRAHFPTRGNGKRLMGALVSLSVIPLPKGAPSQYSVVVSKKVAAKAVDRNRLKRRARETLHTVVAELAEPHLIIAYPKKAALESEFAVFLKEVRQLLNSQRKADR